jgi:uncharacterized protein
VKTTTLLIGLCIFSFFGHAQQYTVKTVPNTRLVTGTYVSNPDAIIQPQTVSAIDSILRDLENKTTVQVSVVVLNSIGDQDIFDFAQELFVEWGIGDKQKDNGLLILLVKDKRTVRFHTGDGIEGILPDATCKQIQMDYMVVYFKQGDYDTGILEGVKQSSLILSNPDDADSLTASNIEEYIPLYNLTFWIILAWFIIGTIIFFVKKSTKSFKADPEKKYKPSYSAGGWFAVFVIAPMAVMIALTLADHAGIFFGGLYAYIVLSFIVKRTSLNKQAATLILERKYYDVYSLFQESQSLFSVLRFVLPLPFAFMYGAYKKQMQFFRDHPRNCTQCGKTLTKLDEKSDDDFLSKGQLLEESLKSVDYDVWKCADCSASERLMYINRHSKFSECPKCQVRAYYQVSDRTIRAATTSSEGTGEEVHSCKACSHKNVRRYTIARVQQSSSSSSGSSGGSWGGGSSSGGGASSSW